MQFEPPVEIAGDLDPDDTLILLFMCCHPSLTPLLGDRADAARRRRPDDRRDRQRVPGPGGHDGAAHQPREAAHQDIGGAFRLPSDRDRAERLGAVLHVLYLIFNEGYASSSGPSLQRSDLANEAIRLTRAVHSLLPDDGEVAGLLALMLLTDARRAARTGADGELIPLAEQDRTLWDRDAIVEGVALVTARCRGDRLAPISCRPPSRRCTTRRREPTTPTGRRSSRYTAC